MVPPGTGGKRGLLPGGDGGTCRAPGICSSLIPGSLPLIALPSDTHEESLQQEISPVAASHMNEKDPP